MAERRRPKAALEATGPFVIQDLMSEAQWEVQPDAEDHRWFESIADLSPEEFILNAQLEVDHPPVIEPILTRDLDGWRANRYIGRIRHQGRTLEILPRLGVDTITNWISEILNVQVLPKTAARGQSSDLVVTQLLAALWRAEVLTAGQHALPRSKQKTTSTSLAVRGRLDVASTVRRHAAGHKDLVSTQHVRSYDNAPARAVVLADQYFDQRLAGNRWRGPRLTEQVTTLRSSTGPRPALPSLRDIRKAKYSPITIKWRRAAELSWRILAQDLLGTAPEDESTYGILIDVAELWELFVLHCAGLATEEVVKHGTSLHASGHLARSTVNPKRTLGKLYPDIMIGNDRPSALIDAKYKRVGQKRSINREDLYQLHAYATTFGPPLAALAYPSTGDHAPDEERLGPWETSTGLLSFLTLPTDRDGCVQKLSDWIRSSPR